MNYEDNETEIFKQKFMKNIEKREELRNKIDEGKRSAYYYVVRGALWDTFKGLVFMNAFIVFFGDCLMIAASALLILLVRYLRDPDAEKEEGIYILIAYGLLMFTFPFVKNYGFF